MSFRDVLVLSLFCLTTGLGCDLWREPIANGPDDRTTAVPASERLHDTEALTEPPDTVPEKLATSHLPNVIRLTSKVISGGFPDGDDAFAELQSLGIKTVISVDGMRPNAALASKHGLRYVHLPHGYAGIPPQRAQQLAKAVSELPGPIYIHCHQGKHRSPAAGATACIGAGLIRSAAGPEVLRLAGTSEHYQGLFDSVRDARQLSSRTLNDLKVEFKEAEVVPQLAESMVQLEERFDALKKVAERNWPSSDLTASLAHEALLVRESFTEMLRMEQVQQRSEEFIGLMRGSELAAELLESGLQDLVAGTATDETPEAVRLSFEAVSKNCKLCHQKSRDLPLSRPGQ